MRRTSISSTTTPGYVMKKIPPILRDLLGENDNENTWGYPFVCHAPAGESFTLAKTVAVQGGKPLIFAPAEEYPAFFSKERETGIDVYDTVPDLDDPAFGTLLANEYDAMFFVHTADEMSDEMSEQEYMFLTNYLLQRCKDSGRMLRMRPSGHTDWSEFFDVVVNDPEISNGTQ
ncbi:hypothetical protein [Neorhizobium galegae]|uniref:hypothetical protein n=1 Tax=Neorhizobium galegae TaxID=399 RepID=UPI00126B55CF|nr:hypothetical protein [Neorhizobium galegae]KAA9385715.1 hypothetical protein F4V88_04175 [Neorhizobium galegae]MCM2497345.1 hypothetical protein [Neorhizobium galegae]